MNLEQQIHDLQNRIDKLYQSHADREYIYPLETERDKLIESACHICTLRIAVVNNICKYCLEENKRK
jgi:hypothetical protein